MATTVTRNPHNIEGKVYASSWQQVIVAFNGVLLDPKDFYEAKGSRYGLQPDGYVNFTDRLDGKLQAITNPADTEKVIAIKTRQKRGHVAIIQHTHNTCGYCHELMRNLDWWRAEAYTNSQNRFSLYSDAQLQAFNKIRQQAFNKWLGDYEKTVGKPIARAQEPIARPIQQVDVQTGAVVSAAPSAEERALASQNKIKQVTRQVATKMAGPIPQGGSRVVKDNGVVITKSAAVRKPLPRKSG